MRLKELQQQVRTSLLMQNKFPLLNDAHFLLLSFINGKSVTAGGHVQTFRVSKEMTRATLRNQKQPLKAM